ncbi:MAG: hypothetical protein SCARUB_02792 [Candidatus Scalindua rubra]|uniref:Uncharacterized protein n=1 Tax=Candidatus Scalindua rubra TaxID=1872076 RepID=A0A1E3X8Y6_9BACT|nr:MAG: hypothetical protein SCARUB_02792 [Candidatus Scalindua rubra]
MNITQKPVGHGINLKDMILWEMNNAEGIPYDTYKLLPNKYEDLDLDPEDILFEGGNIQDGAGALIAFGKMQFTEMQEDEREALKEALLQYCELDTLAMVMIYEHWGSLK